MTQRFPADDPSNRVIVIRALELLGFRLVRVREHIAMVRDNPDGTRTPLIIPSHSRIKGPTLRSICTQAGISREEFLTAYQQT
ncbi:MAG: type II toxin-antitoxin system HicA family toxin [Chloroflexi bacterium]|nr:type II toxin-antitoxin system HicA family toxin [Chloroflexota bacterium]MBI4197717.1 type II toxin-antitoxin system HicA family toxin [Chloroflexota bacterium]